MKEKKENSIKQKDDIEDLDKINNTEENKDHASKQIPDENLHDTEEKNQEESEAEIDEKSNEDKLIEEIVELKEEKIRLLAEMENIRKRFEREKADSIRYGSTNLARDILSLDDNLERALSVINKDEKTNESIGNLIDGLKMVKKDFTTILEKNGVKKIISLENRFDPNVHQAMMEIEKEDIEEGIVVQEIQAGYMMYDRLLRPAMVGVSKRPEIKNVGEIKEIKSEKEYKKNQKNKEN